MNPQTDSQPAWIEMTPGVRRRTLVSAGALMQMLVTLEAGCRLPEHSHPHEQITFIVSGRLRFSIAGGSEVRDLGPGEAIYLAGSRPHSAEALEDTLVADTFSPPREDLREQDRAAIAASARA